MRIPNDQRLIRELPKGTIDLVLGAHDHIWYNEKLSNTVFLKSGTNFRNLSVLKISLKSSESKPWGQDIPYLMQ